MQYSVYYEYILQVLVVEGIPVKAQAWLLRPARPAIPFLVSLYETLALTKLYRPPEQGYLAAYHNQSCHSCHQMDALGVTST